MMAVSLKGMLVVLLLLSSAFMVSSFNVIPAIVLLPFSVKHSQVALEQLVLKPWFGLVSAILEIICGVKVVISGEIKEKLSQSRPTLIIMNHQCRFDWLFFWSYLLRMGSLAKERITLKSSLSKIPLIGWTMDLAMFIFLKRKWTEDANNIADIIQFYEDTAFPVQLLLFPEGTDLSDSNRRKDREFAEKSGLRINEYTMHPRTTGFVHCVNVLRQNRKEFDICDVTISYTGKVMQGEKEMLNGVIPSEVHFFIRRVPSDVSSMNDEELKMWLQQTWKEKENRLNKFYQNHSFGSSSVFKDDWSVSVKLIGFLLYYLFSGCLFFYCLPWTLLVAVFIGIISYIIVRFKGGYSRIILSWNKRKNH